MFNLSILPIGQGPAYYTSNPFPEYFEQNHYTQIEKRIGGKDSSIELNLNIFKEKMRPLSNDFRFEAGTSVQLGVGKYFGHSSNDFNKINVSYDVSASIGGTFSVPTFENDAGTAYPSGLKLPLGGGDYYFTGISGSLIGRANVNYGYGSVFGSVVLNSWRSSTANKHRNNPITNVYLNWSFCGSWITTKKT